MKWISQLILLIVFISVCTRGSSVYAENNNSRATNMISPDCKFSKIDFTDEMKKYEVFPWQILKNKEFKTKYYSMLGNRANVKWLKRLSGPGRTNLLLNTEMGRFVFVSSCMPNSCNTHYIYILYNTIDQNINALLIENEKPVWLGNPYDSIRCILNDIKNKY